MSLGLLELLEHAVRMEEDGRAYYLQVAGKTNNGLAKSTFTVLADEEAKHRRYFEEYYQSKQQEKGWPELGEMEAEATHAAKRAENVFTKAAAEQVVAGEDVDLTEAYSHAMDLERKAIEFYQDMIGAAEDKQVKVFLEFVIAQERGHLDILSRTQDLLDNPQAWYFDTEGWVVEG